MSTVADTPQPIPAGEVEYFDAGVDWITAIGCTPRDVELLEALYLEDHRTGRAAGAKTRPWKFMQYEGEWTASTKLGSWQGKRLMQTSGPAATAMLTRMRSFGGRISRLDVQVTATLERSLSCFATSSISLSTDQSVPARCSQLHTGYSSDSKGLCIGTVGRRTAERYLRVYDKGVETGKLPAGRQWRLEAETKQSLAQLLWHRLQLSEASSVSCYASVQSLWKSAGRPWLLPECSADAGPLRTPPKEPPDAARLAAWVSSSVAPTLPRILTRYTVAQLLELLGLDGLAEPTELGRQLYRGTHGPET